ncbi:hypothetical protein WR25_05141 isoform A [Diploscapter pachys]|uniref:Diacylglycerol kinase n=1 Tax=Diploscapter pachys TaxID=2018661 RepID=A0A2A2JI74_9BILA|nr:hypothetical protein WR25_05141 isoform A [Diploscapter pachys]
MDLYEEILTSILFIAGLSLVILLFRKLLEIGKRKAVNKFPSSGHYWSPIDASDRRYYCLGCKKRILEGYECDYCLLKVCGLRCIRNISNKIYCKVFCEGSEYGPMKHHWIPGNIDSDQFCCVCDELCGDNDLEDFRCSWCIRVVHTKCRPSFPEECDLGELAQSVIPPYCVLSRKPGNRNQRMAVVESITSPEKSEHWCPLMIIVNSKSGSGAGKGLLRSFRAHPHPVQIVDVQKVNLRACLKWIEDHPEINVRILIAGGDGTICSTLDVVDSLGHKGPVAVLPLGTGNDLSRVLGWGKQCGSDINIIQLLADIQNAQVVNVDRWRIRIEPTGGRRTLPMKTVSMTNYISVGVDAVVTLGMQSTRDSMPKALSSRILNKLLFVTFGTKDVFKRECKGLNEFIDLYIDGKLVDLPAIEGLVFLNIQCWGAGVKPWEGAQKEMPQQLDDKKFEVFAVTSSFHIAQLQVGLSQPIHVGQASEAKVVIKNRSLPMQSDGEAWMQNPATITVSHKCQTQMLKKNEHPFKGCLKFF